MPHKGDMMTVREIVETLGLAADEDAVSSEVAETSTDVSVSDSDENTSETTSDTTDNDVLVETTDDSVTCLLYTSDAADE